MQELKFKVIPVTAIQANCYILYDDKDAIIFDAGGDFEIIDEFIQNNKLNPVMLLNTHTHFDHVGAVAKLQKKYSAKFLICKDDEDLLHHAKDSAERYGFEFESMPKVDGYFKDNDIINFADIKIKVIHTPGHTKGSSSFLVDEKILLSGDTLFFESVGRTDFQYSSQNDLHKSICDKLFQLDDDVVVYPGHGRSTTIIHEKNNNPFLDC